MWGRARLPVLAALCLLAALLAACAGTVAGHGARGSACKPVFFGVPGSGQGARNPAPTAVPSGVSAGDAASYGTTIGRLKADLIGVAGAGKIASAAPIDYPAVAVTHYLGGGQLLGGLDMSELQGVVRLAAGIRNSLAGACSGRTVLLAGYSQGAEVIARAVAQLDPDQQQHVAVAMFGNPSFEPGRPGDYPSGATASGIRPTFRRMAFTLPDDVRARTIDICAPGDPVCGVDPTRTSLAGRIEFVVAHVSIHENAYAFGTDGLTERAAAFLWAHR